MNDSVEESNRVDMVGERMMFCPDCGIPVSKKALSCPRCGSPFRMNQSIKKAEPSKTLKVIDVLLFLLVFFPYSYYLYIF